MVGLLSFAVKDIFWNLHEVRENDPLEDLELPREKVSWVPSVYIAVDILASTMKKLPQDSLMDFPLHRLADLLVHLSGLMSNELKKEQMNRWLRTFFNILEVPAPVLRHWLHKLKFEVDESNKTHRRLFRNCEPFESAFLKILSCVFNTTRALDLNEVESSHPAQRSLLLEKLRESVPAFRSR